MWPGQEVENHSVVRPLSLPPMGPHEDVAMHTSGA